jgi:hypothetical protein
VEARRVIAETLERWAFRLLGPDASPGPDGQFHVRRADGSVATLIGTAGAPLEAAIVAFGEDDARLKSLLSPLLPIRRMSRLTNAALLNAAVAQMADDRLFVNVGVWHGFTMLSAMAGNDAKACTGVDNFSEFGGPKEEFLQRFLDRRSTRHRFFEMDYRDFFAAGLDRPLGVYLYDGEHGYENQYRGLMVADPFYAEDAVIVVDDTNLDRARDATLQFAADSRLDWEVVYDQRTAGRRHPTLWNGLMVLQAEGGSGRQVTLPVEGSIEDSLVEGGEDGERDDVDVVSVADPAGVRDVILEGTRGRYVLVVDGDVTPTANAVAHGVKQARRAAAKATATAEG